jgi:hypothetical protein
MHLGVAYPLHDASIQKAVAGHDLHARTQSWRARSAQPA